ncbi:ABC-2 family transporter protein [Paenibacillus sp. HN-1]|nr:ABC-2 family transporter protein [Paenibacillus sp. CGMCC 1.18879]MBY9080748.1 ABC-2 family transporter protein [Paenibacillus sp. CGMCC 1.18879]MBY9085260.1 ABC-2 family transporter protein [Paenibacillus sinensis]
MYVEFMKKAYRQHAVYRVQYYMGLLNAILTIFIGAAIWKAVYGDNQIFNGITQKEMITYSVFGMIMRSMLSMNEFILDHKVRSGEIAADLLKPVRFLFYLFSIVLGETLYNFKTRVLPVVIVAFLAFRMVVPQDKWYIPLFILSLALSYLVLYCFNLILWLAVFWIHQSWSIVTIKNSIILICSGAMVPLWFMPKGMSDFLSWLPFKDIYYTPLKIYLGKATFSEVWSLYASQGVWIVILLAIALFVWKKAQNKLVIQGG